MNQTTEDARKLLNDQFLAPVFFSRLAEYGRVPQNEKEASIYLQMGHDLLASEHQETMKEAAAQESDLLKASEELQQLTQAFYTPQAAVQLKQGCAEWAMSDDRYLAAAVAIADAVQA